MRIALVHHSPAALEILRRVAGAGHEILWEADRGPAAVHFAASRRPDLILLDLDLPDQEALSTIARVMKASPCAILLVTDSVSRQAGRVFEAMGCGALDAVRMPFRDRDGRLEGRAELLKKLATLEKLTAKVPSRVRSTGKGTDAAVKDLSPLIAVGSSTGGPKALATILAKLPAALGAALVIVQHVERQFADGLARWLAGQTSLAVTVAAEGSEPAAGTVLLAETNDHLILGTDRLLHYTDAPRDYPYRPSINSFFLSLRDHWPRRGMAILLTGMGRDGAVGMEALHHAGWYTVAQDEKTSTVYGMPAAAVELAAVDDVLPLEKIAPAICRWVS